jgi:hypothetical protein
VGGRECGWGEGGRVEGWRSSVTVLPSYAWEQHLQGINTHTHTHTHYAQSLHGTHIRTSHMYIHTYIYTLTRGASRSTHFYQVH